MRARIKGGVENVSRSILLIMAALSAVHAARDQQTKLMK
jgi:hypothetical protein